MSTVKFTKHTNYESDQIKIEHNYDFDVSTSPTSSHKKRFRSTTTRPKCFWTPSATFSISSKGDTS